MSKTTLFLIAIVALMACTACTIKFESNNEGPQTAKSLPLKDFDKIAVEGAANVEFSISDKWSVTMTGDSLSLANSEVTVNEAGTLTFGGKRLRHVITMGSLNQSPIKAVVTAPSLSEIVIAGASDINVNSPIKGEKFSVEIAGAGNVRTKEMTVREFNAEMSGAGIVQTQVVGARKVSLQANGAGNMSARLDSCDYVTAELNGVGLMDLSGIVNHFKKDVGGVGKIRTTNLKVANP